LTLAYQRVDDLCYKINFNMVHILVGIPDPYKKLLLDKHEPSLLTLVRQTVDGCHSL